MKNLKFSKVYFLLFLVVLTTEILIALYVNTGFIRFIFGDFLAVILLYFLVKSFLKMNSLYIAAFALLTAYTIELLQLTTFLELLDLHENIVIRTILGNTFSLEDMAAYTLGIITIFLIDIKASAS